MWSSNGVEVHGLDMVKKPLLIQNTVTGVIYGGPEQLKAKRTLCNI